MPDGGGEQAPRLQGGAEPDRGAVAGIEARLLLRLPETGVGEVHRARRSRAGRARAVHPVRGADDRRALRVLQARGAHPPSRARRVAGVELMAGEFAIGDKALLVDAKQRRYLITLTAGGEFHSHTGVIPHADIIGKPEGSEFRSSRGSRFVGFRPRLADFVLKMPRGAQVIYP